MKWNMGMEIHWGLAKWTYSNNYDTFTKAAAKTKHPGYDFIALDLRAGMSSKAAVR